MARYAPGYSAYLAELGYRPRSVVVQLRLVAHVSRWLEERGLEPSALTAEAVEEFLRARRERYVDLIGARALGPLLGYLRGPGVVPELRPSALLLVE